MTLEEFRKQIFDKTIRRKKYKDEKVLDFWEEYFREATQDRIIGILKNNWIDNVCLTAHEIYVALIPYFQEFDTYYRYPIFLAILEKLSDNKEILCFRDGNNLYYSYIPEYIEK